jgi:hypothetical protein
MDVKSLKKQLMAAIAMVLVAAVALSSATYAWFVNNAKVTATDVSVKAATAYSLLISHTKDGTGTTAQWGTTTELAKTVDELTPVSTVGEVASAEITLTEAQGETKAVGIGDGTKVAKGDVRFVTNTNWANNFVTGVSEVSKSSKTTATTSGNNSTYFYSDTFYLKAAQKGEIYLDSTGIGIMWEKYDDSKDSKFADKKLISFTDFAALPTIDTTSLSENSTPTKAKAEAYNEQLTSAQALLKTLRVGLLVTKSSGDSTSTKPVWHEYQLVNSSISDANQVETTLKSGTNADGIIKAVSADDSTEESKNSATNTAPVVASLTNNAAPMNGKTIADYAIAGNASSLATATNAADKIADAAVNEVIQVDVYIWMEGCDYDTVAANINSFSGTGISGLQLGFCLGKVSVS